MAIAASIAVAAAINLLPRLSRLRLPLAFGFGFVHGFGFANALSELDAQGAALLPLLAGFNIGVELAQLAIVALVLPLIYARARHALVRRAACCRSAHARWAPPDSSGWSSDSRSVLGMSAFLRRAAPCDPTR